MFCTNESYLLKLTRIFFNFLDVLYIDRVFESRNQAIVRTSLL